jgi:hypothetical protein|tara:strand:- start:344 stop:487 length:144 start_codon:yes stop_codon:yes gene_type:complete
MVIKVVFYLLLLLQETLEEMVEVALEALELLLDQEAEIMVAETVESV